MGKIDCSNIFGFMSEWERRKKFYEEKGNGAASISEYLKFLYKGNNRVKSLEEEVKSLQKWSDSHPQITRKEKFIQMCKENGFESLLEFDKKQAMGCESCPICLSAKECSECKKYWNELVD